MAEIVPKLKLKLRGPDIDPGLAKPTLDVRMGGLRLPVRMGGLRLPVRMGDEILVEVNVQYREGVRATDILRGMENLYDGFKIFPPDKGHYRFVWYVEREEARDFIKLFLDDCRGYDFVKSAEGYIEKRKISAF